MGGGNGLVCGPWVCGLHACGPWLPGSWTVLLYGVLGISGLCFAVVCKEVVILVIP